MDASAGPSSYAPVSTTTIPPTRGTKRKEPPDASKPKTMRACDRCRNKKTKCDMTLTTANGSGPKSCSICSSLSLECTFDLPLTESRQKRVMRGIQAQANTSTASASTGTERSSQSQSVSPSRSPEPNIPSPSDMDTSQSNPVIPPTLSPQATQQPARRPSVTKEGKTAVSYILHSTPTLPIVSLETFNQRHGLSMQRDSSGNGHMQVTHQCALTPSASHPESLQQCLQNHSWHEILESLVKIYFTHVAPLFPIITLPELFASSPPPPLLLHSICAVAACRASSSQYSGLLGVLSAGISDMLRNEDVLSDVNLANVQVLLILSLCDDLRATSTTVHPSNVGRARLGAAIRMATDLGLNVDSSQVAQRVWSTAMVIDQWSAAKFGLAPLTHDPGLCFKSFSVPGKDTLAPRHPFKFLSALTQLSGLLRKVLLKIYGADGIRDTGGHEMECIKDALEIWRESLPAELKFTGTESDDQAGILHLLYTSVTFLFYRCFMRHSFIVPNHIGLNVDVPVWNRLRVTSSEALAWVDAHPHVLDAPFMVSYAIVLCSLIQYHTWARRKESEGVSALHQLQSTVDTWVTSLAPDFLGLKRNEFEVIQVFLDAVQRVHQPGYSSFDGQRGLNPTVGVQNQVPTSAVGFAFLSDCSRPSGGILVITAEKAKEIKDLPPGTIIIGAATQNSSDPSQPVVQVVGQSDSEVVTPQQQQLSSEAYLGDPNVFSDLLASFSFPSDVLSYGNGVSYLYSGLSA